MDKQTFYSELTERLTKLGVGRHYIERHMKQFDSFFEGKSEEEIENAIREELNNVNRTLPQYKQMRGLEIRKTEFEKTTSRKIKRHKI
ncbi:MAG: hypothetical protein IJ344_03400 [Clostridia bacterium]|nr:hypothetical protein [Clostridia bacterium]